VRTLKPLKRTLPLPASWAPVEYELYKPWLNEDDADHVFFGCVRSAVQCSAVRWAGRDCVRVCRCFGWVSDTMHGVSSGVFTPRLP
jgi:hypothetical protein